MKSVFKKGDVIASLFEVLKVHKGGMGEVYIAYNRDRNLKFALKTISIDHFPTKKLYDRFRQEAEEWLLIGKHRNIVHAQSIRSFDGHMYIMMEYCSPDQQNRIHLSDYFDDPMIDDQVIKWALDFCDGYEYARLKGMKYHGDIKPNNILITSEGCLKITDFGLSMFSSSMIAKFRKKNIFVKRWNKTKNKSEEDYLGLPPFPYVAPEIFFGEKPDLLSDIFSFGVVFYRCLSHGNYPFECSFADFKSYHAFWRNDPSLIPLNHPLFPVIEKCLHKKRSSRPQSFAEIRKSLEKIYLYYYQKDPLPSIVNNPTIQEIKDFALALLELKRFDHACKKIKSAIKMDDEDSQSHNLFGLILFELKKYDKAENEFKRAVEIDPGYFAPRLNLGRTIIAQNRTSEALRLFLDLLENGIVSREVYNNLGVCYQMMMDNRNTDEYFLRAESNYKEAIKLDERYRDAYMNLALLYKNKSMITQALECLNKAYELDSYDPLFAQFYYEEGN